MNIIKIQKGENKKMKKLKDIIMNLINGFCMALADSVPGVSGGTIAFLLGFYDKFINSLNSLMGKDKEKRKQAILFLVKLGIGWVVGFILSVLVLANIFDAQIYKVSSLFLGFIISVAEPDLLILARQVSDAMGNLLSPFFIDA